MTLYIGTSGWQYRDWREAFYRGVPQRRWLAHYAERFRTVEVNNTFYRLPKASTFESWSEGTPDDFVLAPKMNRFLTHIRRLNDPADPLKRFFGEASALGPKLGPVLLQLPPNLRAEPERLRETLEAMPKDVRVAFEPRHESWWSDEVCGVLEEHGAALCLADRGSRPVTPLVRTAGWGYVRFHWGLGRPESCYGRAALERWAERIAELWGPRQDVYAYFNNDPRGCALRDAVVFARAARRAGLRPTRVPEAREVRVG